MTTLDNEELTYQLSLLAKAIHDYRPAALKEWASDFLLRIDKD